MTRRDVLRAGALASLALAMPARGQTPATAPKLNVLFITVDDLNPHLGCYGHARVKTPNIDRLASQGTRFTRAYAQYPSCLPSRISFLSGWHPQRTEVLDFTRKPREGRLEDVVYLPQHFRQSGYATSRLDKIFHIGGDDRACWHLSEEPQPGLPPVPTAGELAALKLEGRVLAKGRFDNVRGERGPWFSMDVADEELYDGMTATRAIDLLRNARVRQQPFFMGVGFRRPHLPWIAPKKYFDLYPYDDIELPPANPNDEQRLPEADHRAMIAHYYACVSYVDAQIGRVLDGLQEQGLAEQTLVVLLGDQGYCFGEREMWFSKGNLWERSLHVPLIMSGPGVAKDRACERVVSLLDVYPTLVEFAGLPRPASGLQGSSLAPFAAEAVPATAPAWRDASFAVWKPAQGPMSVTVRTNRYRYTETVEREAIELIDYESDPFEHRNLMNDPAHKAVRDELAAIVRENRA